MYGRLQTVLGHDEEDDEEKEVTVRGEGDTQWTNRDESTLLSKQQSLCRVLSGDFQQNYPLKTVYCGKKGSSPTCAAAAASQSEQRQHPPF